MKDLFKKEMALSIIVSILVTILFQPLFQLIWAILLSFSASVYSGWLNRIYSIAAFGTNNRTEFIMLYLFYMVLIYVVFILGLLFYQNTLKPILSEAKKNDEPLEDLKIEQLQERIIEDDKELIKIAKRLKNKLILVVVIVVFVLFSIFGAVIEEFASLQLNTSFNQRLTILAPKLTDQEYKEFKALWASMDSREDYEGIKNEMDRIANQYQVELPKPLLP